MYFWRNPLFLLTKNHMKERKRRVYHTIWEIMSGLLVFVVLILMRQLVTHTGEDFELKLREDRLDYVVYYPKTALTDNLMPFVISKYTTTRRFYSTGFYKKQEMQHHLRINDDKTKAVVYFRVLNETIPHLDYSIGLIDDSQHQQRFMNLFTVNPMNAKQRVSLPLMQLQWAIDESFIEYVTGYSLDHKLSFPEYQKFSLDRPISPLDTIYNFLIFCTMIAPLPCYLYNHSRLVLERRSGLKELMRIMGVTPSVLRCSHYLNSVILSVLNSILITIMLKITSTPILPKSNFVIIVFTMMLYFMAINSIAFVTSVVGQGYEHSNGLALVMYITPCALSIFWYLKLHSYTVAMYLGCFLLPHAPIFLFWDEVKYMENAGVGLNFDNIAMQHPSIYTVIPVAYTWVAFIFQLIVVWLVVWYLDVVVPGLYGVAQSRNFLFRKDYWKTKKKVHFHVTSERKKAFMHDERFFQHAPHLPVAIKLVHVSKLEVTEYRSVKYVNHALNEVNLDIYQGEVTVLLGVEGAGKSTLVSVITGMTKATYGNIYVNGFDTTRFLRTIQKELGYCPQQHLTFAYLTVEENITLFEQLRGEQKEDQTSTEELMTRLRLKSKADMFSYQLTPSAERCLQVACALAGGADILILDEPTSNCDSETRHYLWDIIMELRGLKTIVMTTSSIEEADAVGDRIALFSKGKIICHGTPKFLKNAIGTGFNLSVTLKNVEAADAVRALVESTLHDTVTTRLDPKRLLFTLPAKDHELFPDLFDDLEKQKVELGIVNMGVGMSLEEMFLGFIEDTYEDAVVVETYHGYQQLQGWRLLIQQIDVQMKRIFEHMWSHKCQFTLLQIILPVIGLIVITVTTNTYRPVAGESPIPPPIGSEEKRHNSIGAIREIYPEWHGFRTHGPPWPDITGRKNNSFQAPEKNVIKFVMRPDRSDLYISFHSLPEATKSLNKFSNIYMSHVVPQLKSDVIALSATDIDLFIPKETILCMFWAIGVTFFAAIPLIKFIELLIYEHRFLVRYTHRAVGSSNFIHWTAKLFAQMTLFFIVIPPAVIICALQFDAEETLTQGDFLGAVFLALMMFLPAFLLQLYGLSFLLHNEIAVSQIYIISIGLGFAGPVIQRLLLDFGSSTAYICPLQFLSIIGNLCPVITLSEIITSYTTVARAHSFCSHNDHYCKDLVTTDAKAKILDEICCDPNRKQYFFFSGPPLVLLITLICQIILYGLLLVSLQKKKIHKLFERIVNVNYSEPKFTKKDESVIKETAEVDRMMNCVKDPKTCVGERPPDDTLLVHNLHKRFCHCGAMRTRVINVKGVSFKVDAGDSLVLLGPHSSGKTTVLYLMTGTSTPTRGDCYIGGTSLEHQRSKFVDKLALSIGGLDRFSTGFNNLKRLCMLHGLRSADAALFTVTCMAYMGLESLMHVPVSAYNPGTSRRLGLCVALLSAPPVVLVDEVMQQLEPHTRPLVRRALASLRSRGSAIVMCEHSVAWRDLDSLDTRIGVMNEGHLIALGSIEHVRKLLADGHMARLKLKRKSVRKSDSDELRKEVTDGEINQFLKFQSKMKKRTVGLNVAKSDNAESATGKDQPKAKRKKKTSRDNLKEAPDTEDMDVNSKLAKAKVDVPASQFRKSSYKKLKTIEEDDSAESIVVEVREIPVEENVEPENKEKNENIPEKEDDVERSQTTKEEKKEETDSFQTTQKEKTKSLPDEAGSSREKDQAGASGETDKVSIPDKKDEADNVQSTEEEKTKNMPDEAGSSREKDQAGTSGETDKASIPDKKDEADNVQSTEEGKNETTPDQKDKVVDQNQQLEQVKNIPAAEKPEDMNKSTTASKTVSQNEEQAGSSSETDKATTLAAKIPKEDEYSRDDELFLEYENLLQSEESRNVFEFKPYVSTVTELKKDFKLAFPTSHLAEEHLSMLYFYIKGESDESKMQYSKMFTKLEHLKSVYNDLIEDYTLSEISIDDVYCHLESESAGYKQIKFGSI